MTQVRSQQNLKETIIDYSFGVIATAINLTLSLVIFGADLTTGRRSPASVTKAAESAATFTGIDKEILRRAFWKAQNRGLLRRKRERGTEFLEATEQGKTCLKASLPRYFSHRPWDKRLYLVTYDIPEEKHTQRKILQKHLEKIGASRLQYSTYLILWDPTDVLKELIRDHELSGMVIISDTGTDGSIGDRDIDELVWDVFKLEELNQRYKDFIKETKAKHVKLEHLVFLYLSILKDDPQIPFELLPPTWMGDKAYLTFQKIIGNSAKEIFLSADRPVNEKKDPIT